MDDFEYEMLSWLAGGSRVLRPREPTREGEEAFREVVTLLARLRDRGFVDYLDSHVTGMGWQIRPPQGGCVEEGYGQREARLRPEFAAHYPYLTPGVWEPAAMLADRVVANILGRPNARFISKEHALDPAHFDFRGSQQRPLDRRRIRLEDTAPG